MKFLYYSLYVFYTKIIFVQKHYPPIVSVVGLIAALEVFLLAAIVDTYFFISTGEELVRYPAIIPFGLWLLFYWLNKNYFIEKENDILEEIDAKDIKNKIFIFICSFIFVVIVFWLWIGDGLYKIVTLMS